MRGKYIKIIQSSIAMIRRLSITTQHFCYSLLNTSCYGLHGHHHVYNYKILMRKLGCKIKVSCRIKSHSYNENKIFLNNALFSNVTHLVTYSSFIKIYTISC